MKEELKWHPVSEKPTKKFATCVVITTEGCVRYDASYDEDDGFELWDEDNCIWRPIFKKVVGWMYETELTEFLKSLEIDK